VDAEELPVLDSHQCMAAVRALQSHRLSGISTGDKGFAADFALVFATAAGIVVEVSMGSPADRADSVFRDSLAVPAFYRLERLFVLPLVVFDEEFPVLLYERDDDRRLIHRVFLVLRRMGVVISPLLEWDVLADKVQKPSDNGIELLNCID